MENKIPMWLKIILILISVVSATGASLSYFATKTELTDAVKERNDMLKQEKSERIYTDEKNEKARTEALGKINDKLDLILIQLGNKANRKD